MGADGHDLHPPKQDAATHTGALASVSSGKKIHQIWRLARKAGALVGIVGGLAEVSSLPSRTDLAEKAAKHAVTAAVQANDCGAASVANKPVSFGPSRDFLHVFPAVAGVAVVRIGSIGANGKIGVATYRLETIDTKTGETTMIREPLDVSSKTCAKEILLRLNGPTPIPVIHATPGTDPSIPLFCKKDGPCKAPGGTH